MKRTLGVCYYPEHWPEDRWATDAAMMREAGLTWVRIGEFAWSRLEPAPGDYRWDWLHRAVDTLRAEGLKIVMGTPSATPPRWMLDRHPDMLAVDALGHPRKFGSRRHYCFSHEGYRADAARMAGRMAAEFPDVEAWQIDNEYGCHDTTISYSDAARGAFRDWCAQRYQSPQALNRAWGNVFWSMDYDSFDQIDLPNLTVTEPNPSHALAFRRFSSDQVVRWNAAQVAAIRAHSDAPISHNYMGKVTEFDHYTLGEQMEIATWDSYPMGFLLDRVPGGDQAAYLRQGDPDFQAFHHDLYRSVGKGRWWVMEQQPGPVNWAPSNPAPLPGMVRLWTWEAFAHGAEAVSYFRWRQAPMAQEQHHAGLLRADATEAPGLIEARRVAAELAETPDIEDTQAPVALIFDYASQWAWDVLPQGEGFSHFDLCFDLYRALRGLGFSIDVLPPDTADLSGYALTVIPALLSIDTPLRNAITTAPGLVVTGPRTGLCTSELTMALPLGPGVPGLDAKAVLIETLPPEHPRPLKDGGKLGLWIEHLEGDFETVEVTSDGLPAVIRQDRRLHLAGWPDADAARRLMHDITTEAGLTPRPLPQGIRIRQAGRTEFIFNYAAERRIFEGETLEPADLLRRPARQG